MTLLIDVGNSAIKWAQQGADGGLRNPQWLWHRNVSNVDGQLLERWRGQVQAGDAVVACNVAAAGVAAAVEKAAHALQLRAVRWLQSQARFDGPFALINGYANPLQLGADRWHCMLGACAITRASVVVVNAGTATTVDCIDAEHLPHGKPSGKFVGGVIAPGMRLMLDSLEQGAAGLPAAAGAAADFPNNTDAAIITGVLDAQIGLIERVWRRFAARLHTAEPGLILTGGNAPELLNRLSIKTARIEDNLVLRGLALRAKCDVDLI